MERTGSDGPERAPVPDYDLAATLRVGGVEVHRALADPRRRRIVSVLSERAATARQLAAVIERSPQATSHHLDVLRDAGLVRVVRTRRVRAVEERWWGRTARLFIFDGPGESRIDGVLEEARAEAAAAAALGEADVTSASTIRYARIPAERAAEWVERLVELADEFSAQPRDGDVVHGLVAAVFPTAWPAVPLGDDETQEAS